MKTILLVMLILTCASCAKKGAEGGGAPIPAPVLGPQCKTINDRWISTTDNEVHDLSALVLNAAAYVTYKYTGYNGTLCPPIGQPQTAKLFESAGAIKAAGFQYSLYFTNNNPGPGCEYWQASPTTAGAYIKFECNKITMCKTLSLASGCQEFN